MARCLLATLFIPLDDPILQPLRADGHDVAAVDSISVRTENALIDALQIARALHAGQIAGAALDVFDREPLPSASPLRQAPNLILTPHMAGVTAQSRTAMAAMAVENVARVLRGEPPVSCVNPEVLTRGT